MFENIQLKMMNFMRTDRRIAYLAQREMEAAGKEMVQYNAARQLVRMELAKPLEQIDSDNLRTYLKTLAKEADIICTVIVTVMKRALSLQKELAALEQNLAQTFRVAGEQVSRTSAPQLRHLEVRLHNQARLLFLQLRQQRQLAEDIYERKRTLREVTVLPEAGLVNWLITNSRRMRWSTIESERSLKQLTGLISSLPRADKRGQRAFEAQMRTISDVMSSVEAGVRDEVHAIGTEVQYSIILLMRIMHVLKSDEELLELLVSRGIAPEIGAEFHAAWKKIDEKANGAAYFARQELRIPTVEAERAANTLTVVPQGREMEEPRNRKFPQAGSREQQRRAA